MQVYLYVQDGVISKAGYGEVDTSQTYIDRVKDAKLLESFVGSEVSSLNALSADTVSGATGSSKGVLNAVNAAVEYYKEHVGGENNG